MKHNNLCVVVIPIHSDNPSNEELISFKQCFNVLKKHSIKIIAPKGLNLDIYRQVVASIEVIEIDPIWQSSIEKYNKLKLSWFFYNLFREFDYLLTYELDAFVFKDEIEFWCEKKYDYIGAPWFLGYNLPLSNDFIGVGNSGFSLRKISSMRIAIRKIYFEDGNYNLLPKKKRLSAKIERLRFYLNIFRKENRTIQKAMHFNEDWFVSFVIPKYIVDFNIAPINDAIKFSFEVQPSYLYELNNKNLPMGCHAWQKYDFEFWKPFIEDFGYKINA
jgi:hypothetical protein